MKLESESLICHSKITKKPDSKHHPFTPDTKALESRKSVIDYPGQKGREDILKENQKEVGFDFEDNKANEDPALKVGSDIDGWVKFGDSMRMEDLSKDNEKGIIQFMKSESEDESEHRGSVFYMDKSVMECDVPELVVCYKENAYQVVKDICVDEGVPIQDKFLFDNGVDETNVWDLMPPGKDIESKAVNGKEDMDMHEASAPSGEVELDKENSNQYDSRDLMQKSDSKNRDSKNFAAEVDEITEKISEEEDEASKELPTLAQLLLMRDLSMEHSNSSTFDKERSGIYVPSLQNASREMILASPSLVHADQEPDNVKKKADLVSSQASEPAESANESLASEVVCDKDMHSRNVTDDHDSSALAHSSKEECGETIEVEPLENGHTYRMEETSVLVVSSSSQADHSGSSSSATDLFPGAVSEDNGQPCSNELPHSSGESSSSARAPLPGSLIGNSSRIEDNSGDHIFNDLQQSQGETSFSASGPVSGLVSYSGRIAYSGSLSLRSDSSTTSTRSFAFPVLQSEWSSSPVRMAKADRSQLRKRWWRQTLLCCRF